MATNRKTYRKHSLSTRMQKKSVQEKERGVPLLDGKDFTQHELRSFWTLFLEGQCDEKISAAMGRTRNAVADRRHKLVVGYSKLDECFAGPLRDRTNVSWTDRDEWVYKQWHRHRQLQYDGESPAYVKAMMDEDRLSLLLGRSLNKCKVLRKRLNQTEAAHKGFDFGKGF
jgi:hypothetical protein